MASASLRIALTHPCFFPYVRRGAERALYDLAHYLGSRGHRVTVITGGPGPVREVEERGFTVRYLPYLRHPVLMRGWPRHHYHLFALPCLAWLLKGRYDLVHSLWHADAWAGTLACRLRGLPSVVHLLTPPSPEFPVFREHPAEWRLLRSAVRRADRVLGVSAYVTRCLREAVGRDASVVIFPVDTEFFRPAAPREAREPQILYAGSLTDPRKNVPLLLRAFGRLLRTEPGAVLVLSGPVSPEVRRRLLHAVEPRVRARVRLPGLGRRRDLPRLYSTASVTVLPSAFEAQGLILTESLACGTPVVGADAGAIPEVISDPAVGTLFPLRHGHDEETVEGLASALERTLELSRDPATPGRCREHARTLSWEALGPRYEEVYLGLLDGRRGAAPRPAAGEGCGP